MSELKATKANDEPKKQDEKDEELKPEDLNQISGGGYTSTSHGTHPNHNQTCTFIG